MKLKKIAAAFILAIVFMLCVYVLSYVVMRSLDRRHEGYAYFTTLYYCELHGAFEVVTRHHIWGDVFVTDGVIVDFIYDLGLDAEYLDSLNFFDRRVLIDYKMNIFLGWEYVPKSDIPIVFDIPPAGVCICP